MKYPGSDAFMQKWIYYLVCWIENQDSCSSKRATGSEKQNTRQNARCETTHNQKVYKIVVTSLPHEVTNFHILYRASYKQCRPADLRKLKETESVTGSSMRLSCVIRPTTWAWPSTASSDNSAEDLLKLPAQIPNLGCFFTLRLKDTVIGHHF